MAAAHARWPAHAAQPSSSGALAHRAWTSAGACAGTVAALYRVLARAAGLPEAERPEERLLVVESAQHRISRRLVRARAAQAAPGRAPHPGPLQGPGPGMPHRLRPAKQRRARSSACCPQAGLLIGWGLTLAPPTIYPNPVSADRRRRAAGRTTARRRWRSWPSAICCWPTCSPPRRPGRWAAARRCTCSTSASPRQRTPVQPGSPQASAAVLCLRC